MAGKAGGFGFADFVVRFLFIFALLTAIYNPTGYSYVDWLMVPDSPYLAVKVFVGLTLGLVLAFIMAMAHRALKGGGVALALLFFGSLAWALDSQGLLPRAPSVLVVLIQAGAAAGLAAGLSLVIVRQTASGQVTASDELH